MIEAAWVERIGGEGPADLLVEVPHGADERAHYDAVATALRSELPADLHAFFHFNTDVGAWALGRRVAELVTEARPGRSALLVRALIPRTFVDVNRHPGAAGGALSAGGVTPGLQPWVRDPADREALLGLHRRYLEICEAGYAEVCGDGGLAFLPHTYGPRTVGIDRVDDGIVTALRAALVADLAETWPLRAEVDLLTRTPQGVALAATEVADGARRGLEARGYQVAENHTYNLHPDTMGAVWAGRYPGRTLCLEVRRDLLVPVWTPFEPMIATPDQVEPVAEAIAEAFAVTLAARGR